MHSTQHTGRRNGVNRWLAALVVAGTLMPVAASASLETDILDRWYTLLGQANASGLSGLLAPRAKISLDDLGITQNKREFLESMEEWRAAIEGGAIRYRIEATSAGQATALVCYEFKTSDLLTKEVFRMVNGLITQSKQTKVAENCEGFAK